MGETGLLLHACCAPCTAGVLPALEGQGIHPVLYWNNPNIHPAAEYVRRLDALRDYSRLRGVPLVVDGGYGLREFLSRVPDPQCRCVHCYAMRLDAVAEHAARNGFQAFSTTLLVSPHQDHELVRKVGEQCARRHGIPFLYADFRPGYEQGRRAAQEMGIHIQKYCGCIFSEEERLMERLAKRGRAFYPNFPPDPDAKVGASRRRRLFAENNRQ